MEQILVQFQAEISNLMPLGFVTGENRRQPFSGCQPVYKLGVTNRFFVGAVPVAAELVTVSEDGTRDYSAFYDIDRIREQIH